MDNRERITDRTDALRPLSQALARGAFQILQPPLQHKSGKMDVTVAPRVRGSGGSNGDQRWVAAECEHCGGPLPDGSSANRMYCSKACKQTVYTAHVRAGRIAARQDRKCLWCNGQIPAEARGNRIYCNKACQDKSQLDMSKSRRTCQQCGKTYRGRGGPFCSHACYCDSRRKRHPKRCPICQQIFKPHRVEQVTCSQKCRYEGERRARQG